MPRTDAGKPSKKKRVYKLPKTRVPEAAKPKPKPKAGPPTPRPKPPTKAETRRARAQERQYGSQGRAVERVANEQKRTSRSRSQEKQYKSQGEAVKKQAAEQRRRTTNLRTGRRVRRTRDSVSELVERELEGRGKLAKFGRKLGEGIENAGLVSTGTGPAVPSIYKKKGGLGPGFATTVPQRTKIPKNSVVLKGLKDLANLPAVAVPSVYEPAAGAVEAAQGRPERLKRVAKAVNEGDPVFNTVAAGVEAARGNPKAAKERLRRAKEAAEEHPGLTLLQVVGTKGALGRGGGTVMRSPAAPKKVRRVASTKRQSRQVPGTKITERREYSRDVITKAGQRAVEGTRRKIKRRYDRKADAAEKAGKKDRADELRTAASRVDPDRLPEREIRRQIDEQVAANEDIRRTHRSETNRSTRKIVKKVEREGAATSVVAQRITRADKDDLRAYVRELAAEHDSLSKSQQRSNRQLRQGLDRVINDKNADLAAVARAADEYEKLVRPLQRKLVKRGFVAKGQAERAVVIPYAVRNMNAKHDPDKGLVVERKLSSAEREKRIAELEQIVEFATQSASRQRETGKFAFGKANEVHMERAAAEAKAEISRLKKGGGELEPLPTEQILAHMKANGVKAPAFVTQAPNMRGGRNFNIRSERVPAMRTQRRTGQATIKGTFDADPETLVEGAARAQGLIDAADGFKRTIKRNGFRGEDGKLARFKSWSLADETARELAAASPGSVKMRPVRVNPQWGSKKQLDALLDEVDALDQPQANQIVTAMRDALEGKTGNGPWALIPDAAAKRLLEHLDVQGGGGGIKTLQLANQAFRRNVLTTSPTKITGDVVEGLFRASIARAGPRSYVTGKKTLEALKGIDAKAAEEAIARTVGGGHYGLARGMHIRRGAQQFEGTSLEGVANALGKFWRVSGPKAGRVRIPGPKQFADLWHGYTNFVLDAVSNVVESQIQTAMLGKALRDSPLMDGHLLKLSESAINDAAKGLLGTADQIAFGRKVDRMMGKYGKYSPTMKKALATYTPFVAWWLNAVYFVYRTLPRDHPVVTTLLASAEMATEEWRKDEGLDLFLERGKLPDFMQGSIPLEGGGHQRAPNRYLPFAAFSDFGGTVRGQVLPLWSSPLAALDGLDWTGRKLYVKGADGKSREPNQLEKIGLATLSFGKGTVPWYSTIERVAEQGPDAVNPVRVTKPPENKKKLKISKPGAGTGQRKSSSSSGSFFGGEPSGGSSGGSFFGGNQESSPKSGGGFFD